MVCTLHPILPEWSYHERYNGQGILHARGFEKCKEILVGNPKRTGEDNIEIHLKK
jgi:hypothetical protein